MATVPQFLPFLTDDQGRSLVKEGGVVVTRPIPEWQENSPEGWEENTIQYSRNMEFLGLIKAYVTNLKFFLDSAFILRDWFYRLGMEVVMLFIWLKLDQNFGGEMKHKGWYKGEVDFGTFKDDYDGVEVNITEGGFHKELTANKGVPYEYVLGEDPETVSLEMDGMEIFEKALYQDADGVIFSPTTLGGGADRGLTATAFIGNEGFSRGIDFQTQNMSAYPSFADTIAQANCLLMNNFETPILFTISGKSEFFCVSQNGNWAFRRRFLKTSSTIPTQNDYEFHPSTGTMVVGDTYSHDFSIQISLSPGERLYSESIFFGGVSGNPGVEFTVNSKFIIDFVTLKPLTVIDAYTVYGLGNKLTKSMSNNRSTLGGALLLNDVNLLCTSGEAIRGFTDPKVKTKFNDWYKSVDALKCIALEITNNNPVIESRYDKFNNTVIANLGECRNFLLEVADDLIFDVVEAGYVTRDMDNVNGRYSFMDAYTWKSPVSRIKNTYDCRSLYYADPYVIEITRINLDGKTSTDGRTDNDMFFIDAEKVYNDFTGDIQILAAGYITLVGITGLALKPGTRFRLAAGINAGTPIFKVANAIETGGNTKIFVDEPVVDENINTTVEFRHYKLRRLVYDSITGVPSPLTVFNVEISTKRNLMNHYRWLRSSWDHMDSKFLVFQTTPKNADFETIDSNNITISEKANVLIGNMGDKVFLPYYINFEVQSPYNLRELMVANSGGYFDFSSNSLGLKGFPWDIKTNDATLESQEYKVLATAGNDLFQLTKNR